MSLYNCHFDLVVQVEDPNGIELNDRMTKMCVELNDAVREKHPISCILPRGFKIVEE